MELYYVLGIVDRNRAEDLQNLCRELKLSVVVTNFGKGTATSEHLSLYDLQPTEKAIVGTIVTGSSMKQLMRAAKRKMFIDIPGNGIMMAIPHEKCEWWQKSGLFYGRTGDWRRCSGDGVQE